MRESNPPVAGFAIGLTYLHRFAVWNGAFHWRAGYDDRVELLGQRELTRYESLIVDCVWQCRHGIHTLVIAGIGIHIVVNDELSTQDGRSSTVDQTCAVRFPGNSARNGKVECRLGTLACVASIPFHL